VRLTTLGGGHADAEKGLEPALRKSEGYRPMQYKPAGKMYETTFDPPILLNRCGLPQLPMSITTRREAAAVFAMLPPCGIQWCGVAACLDSWPDMARLRLALATALERDGFLSLDDVDACGHWQQ